MTCIERWSVATVVGEDDILDLHAQRSIFAQLSGLLIFQGCLGNYDLKNDSVFFKKYFLFCFVLFCFFETGFLSVALVPVPELAL